MTATETTRHDARPLTHDDVTAVLGPLPDAKIAAIIESGATVADLEQAKIWLAGSNDAMADLQRQASGAVAAVCDIVTADEVDPDREP